MSTLAAIFYSYAEGNLFGKHSFAQKFDRETKKSSEASIRTKFRKLLQSID
jgi:hypothetical protein